MGLFGAIGSFIGGCISAVGSLCSSIGGAVMSGVAALAPVIGRFLPVIGPIISLIASLFAGKPEKEEPEEIGMKAELADVKPEDFDSIGEYIDYLRNNIKLDAEKLKNLTPEERAKYQITGLGLYIKDIEEKQGIYITPEFLETMPAFEKQGYKPEEIATLMKSLKGKGIEETTVCQEYLKGDLQAGSKEQRQVYGSIKELVEKHFEGLNVDVDQKIDDLKDEYKKIK